ncbi:MAG: transglutaminase TgpA family protein [Oceanidesulfovibrio sp.]
MADRANAPGDIRVFGTVVLVLVCSLAPHLLRMPPWLIVWCLFFWTYAVLGRVRRWPMPGPNLLVVLAVGGNSAVFLSVGFTNLFGLGLAALAVLLGLKPMEMRSHRDRMVTVYLSLFLVLGSVYYTESLFATAYVAFMVVLLLATLTDLTRRRGTRADSGTSKAQTLGAAGIRHSLGMALRLVVMSVPIAVVLFLVFPRLPQGMLGYEAGSRGGGFAAVMEPGSLSGYAMDENLDFRVRFEGSVVPSHLQYWRARTLSLFDGRAWHVVEPRPLAGSLPAAGGATTYTVLLEPRTDRILPVLDVVREVESDLSARIFSNWTVRANSDLRTHTSYTGASVAGAEVPHIPGAVDPDVFLQLPPGNPQTRELASQWRNEPAAERAKRGLAYLAEQPYVYTLEPPALGETDTIDAFLFRTRAGFCEHFASAYAYLMRAAGVPSRVVVGYQGGEFNNLDDYLMVRRLNTHAWVEIQLPGRGWVRVDPTGAAAPERISQGALQALRGWNDSLLRNLVGIEGVRQVVAFIQMAWDMVSFRWQTWVLGYDFQRQLSFLSRLGVDFRSMRGKAIVLVATLLCLVLAGAAYSGMWGGARTPARDKSVALYERFTKKLARAGMARQAHEPPQAFADSVARSRPDLEQPVQAITNLYVQARYGPPDDGGEDHLAELERLVRDFRADRGGNDPRRA